MKLLSIENIYTIKEVPNRFPWIFLGGKEDFFTQKIETLLAHWARSRGLKPRIFGVSQQVELAELFTSIGHDPLFEEETPYLVLRIKPPILSQTYKGLLLKLCQQLRASKKPAVLITLLNGLAEGDHWWSPLSPQAVYIPCGLPKSRDGWRQWILAESELQRLHLSKELLEKLINAFPRNPELLQSYLPLLVDGAAVQQEDLILDHLNRGALPESLPQDDVPRISAWIKGATSPFLDLTIQSLKKLLIDPVPPILLIIRMVQNAALSVPIPAAADRQGARIRSQAALVKKLHTLEKQVKCLERPLTSEEFYNFLLYCTGALHQSFSTPSAPDSSASLYVCGGSNGSS